MNQLAESTERLIPLLYTKNEFSKPRNEHIIADEIKAMSETVHTFSREDISRITGRDPLASYAVLNMEQNLKGALKSFKEGNLTYSKMILKSTFSYCFNCHSRNIQGRQLNLNIDLTSFHLQASEKAELAFALRDYDAFYKTLTKYLEGSKNEKNSFEKDTSLKYLLAYSVRVKNDPMIALRVLKRVRYKEKQKYKKDLYRSWEKSLSNMAKDKEIKPPFQRALMLFDQAKKNDAFKYDEHRYVDYLRITNLLHNSLLQSGKSKEERARSFLVLGMSYDVLHAISFWGLPNHYFEACIHEAPKSKIAKKCLQEYEDNIIFGYSGSSGTHVPYFETQKIQKLRALVNAR